MVHASGATNKFNEYNNGLNNFKFADKKRNEGEEYDNLNVHKILQYSQIAKATGPLNTKKIIVQDMGGSEKKQLTVEEFLVDHLSDLDLKRTPLSELAALRDTMKSYTTGWRGFFNKWVHWDKFPRAERQIQMIEKMIEDTNQNSHQVLFNLTGFVRSGRDTDLNQRLTDITTALNSLLPKAENNKEIIELCRQLSNKEGNINTEILAENLVKKTNPTKCDRLLSLLLEFRKSPPATATADLGYDDFFE